VHELTQHVLFWPRAAQFRLLVLVAEGIEVRQSHRARGMGRRSKSQERQRRRRSKSRESSPPSADEVVAAKEMRQDDIEKTKQQQHEIRFARSFERRARARLGGNSWFDQLPPPEALGPDGWESELGRRVHFPPREYEQKWVHHGWPLFGLVHYLRNLFVHGPQSVRDGVFPTFEAIEDYIRHHVGWLFVDLWCVDQKLGGKFSRQVAMGQGLDVRRKMQTAAA